MCLSDSLYEPIPVYPLVYIVCLLSWNMVGCVLTDYPGQAVSISQYRLFIIKTHLRPQTSDLAGAGGQTSQHHISTSGDIALTNHWDHAIPYREAQPTLRPGH